MPWNTNKHIKYFFIHYVALLYSIYIRMITSDHFYEGEWGLDQFPSLTVFMKAALSLPSKISSLKIDLL